jgi:hypothetical protein
MRRAAALTALVIAFGPAASPASAQDSARGSGTYQFEPGRSYGLGTVRFNARGTATEATGSISIRIPDYPDDEWNQTVRARVTCINARGNLAVIAGRITKIREQYAEDLRYFRLVVRDALTGSTRA